MQKMGKIRMCGEECTSDQRMVDKVKFSEIIPRDSLMIQRYTYNYIRLSFLVSCR